MLRWTVPLRGGPTGGCLQGAVAVEHKLYTFGESPEPETADYLAYLTRRQITVRQITARPLSVYVLNTGALHWRKLSVRRRRGESQTRLRPEVPHMRVGHSAVLVEGIVYVWGGGLFWFGDADGRVYAFDVDTHRWLKTKVSGTRPDMWFGHSACVLGRVMYVHGGRNSSTQECNNDTYKLDTSTMVWSSISSGGDLPPASSNHQATIIGTKMFVVGGCGRDGLYYYYDSIRVFDTETSHWLSITPPAQPFPNSYSSYGEAFAYNGELYVFGGSENFYGLWKFNTKTFSWKKVELKGKGPSKGCSPSCCCTLGDRVFLFYKDLVYILDLSPCLQTFCKLAVIQHGLDTAELPHHIKWELAAMMSGGNWELLGTGRRWELELDGTWKKVTRRKWEMTAGGNWRRVGRGSHDVSWELAEDMNPPIC